MLRFWRICILAGLLASLGLLGANAQEPDAVTIDGSLFMEDLVAELLSNYADVTETDPAITLETNGPNAAFEALCTGERGAVMSTRYINDDEANLCEDNDVDYVEYMAAYQGIVVLLTAPETDPAAADLGVPCVTVGDLDTIFGLTAEGATTQTTEIDPNADPDALAVYSLPSDSRAAVAFSAILPSGELRTDLDIQDNPAAIIDALSAEDARGVGYMTLHDWLALDDNQRESVLPLEIRNPTDATCHPPSALNIETRTYAAHRPLVLYAATSALENESFADFLQVANSGLVQDTATTLGFTPITDNAQTRNAANLTTPNTGRTFSRPSSPPSLNPTPEGTVVLVGDPLAVPVINAMVGNFNASNDNASTDFSLLGLDAGWQALCAGEADALFSTVAEARTCDENDVEAYELSIGTQAFVFAVDADQEDLPTCLDVETLARAFATFPTNADEDDTEADDAPTTWQALTDDAPDTPLFVFMADRSTAEIDWLLRLAGAENAFPRSDRDDNVIYNPIDVAAPGQWRAQALANLEGGAGLAIIGWDDYQNRRARQPAFARSGRGRGVYRTKRRN
ncbi:MAG: hypothetical protein ACLFTK_12980, partial [Anaerolineales bacterium]